MELKNYGKVKRLYADIETSPNIVLAFRAGYNQTINPDAIVSERKIICIGYKWEGKPVRVIRWDQDQDYKMMLMQFIAVASQADEIVWHYGNGFDKPFIMGRCLIHGLIFPNVKSVDTKAWAAKNFLFNSNKLDYIATVLGYGGKEKMGFSDWKDIVMKKCPKALNKMCHYCGMDVVLLEKIFLEMATMVKPETHAGVLAGGEKWSCPRDGSTNVRVNKKRVTANGSIQVTFKCQDCGGYYTVSESVYKRFLEASKGKVSKVRLPASKRKCNR